MKAGIGIVAKEGRDMTRLPVDDAHDLFGLSWVDKDIVIMQIIMPEARPFDGSILWYNRVNDLLVT
jgi:hypothetical protein